MTGSSVRSGFVPPFLRKAIDAHNGGSGGGGGGGGKGEAEGPLSAKTLEMLAGVCSATALSFGYDAHANNRSLFCKTVLLIEALPKRAYALCTQAWKASQRAQRVLLPQCVYNARAAQLHVRSDASLCTCSTACIRRRPPRHARAPSAHRP
jgi:hypothetical protein